ncbi:hypothetical protein [Brachyspira hampsonii]|uniref:hypothetical protein n=1 Tax=Brachyspira hampsonii TaxID=1287055 RepID=UPI0021099E93|nr:hypothetical protein [Brachyspira hampsonii]
MKREVILFILISMYLFLYDNFIPKKSVYFINDCFNCKNIINIYETAEFYEVILNDNIVIHFDLDCTENL